MGTSKLIFVVCSLPVIGLISTNYVHADPIVAITNTPNVTAGGSQVKDTDWKGLLFSTSDSVSEISSIQLGLNCWTIGSLSCSYPSSPKIQISLFSVASEHPSTQLETTPLQTVPMASGMQMYSFAIPNWQMAANTSYALVIQSDSSGIKWGSTGNSPEGTTPTGLNGFTYIGFNLYSSSTGLWTSTGLSQLNAVEISVTQPTMSDGRTYLASDLGITANPVFDGGTLQMNQIANNYSQAFTVDASGGTINTSSGSALLSGVFSGTGGLTISGNGSLTLSGNNSFSGGTIVNSGSTLILSGSNTTTGVTQVNSGATLSINSGAALGSGRLDLIGSSTTPATLAITGNTTINNNITVAYDPVFDVAASTTTTIAAVIADGVASGDVVVQGGGTLNLTNTNTYTGPTTITNDGSTLALSGNGSIAHSSSVTNGGNLDLSNSGSTVTMGGDFTQLNSGNLLMAGLTPTANQLLNITGSASLGGTLTLNASAGSFSPSRYTLLTALGGVSNRFTSLSTNLSSLTRLGYALSYDANDVYLNFTPNVDDTQAALQANANALRGVYAIQTGTINNSLTYDCNHFGSNGFCVSTGGRYSNASNSHANTTSAMVVGGYRVNDNIRVGAFVDQNLYNTEVSSIASLRSNTPLVGLFAVWNENPDQTGFEAKLSAAYNNSNLDMKRATIATSEAGYGIAGMDTISGSGTLSYGFKVAPSWIASPFFGVRHTTVSMGGYSEQSTDSVTAPLIYRGLNQENLTALVGLRALGKVDERTILQTSVGLEQDMHTYTGAYSVTGLDGLSSINFNPNMQKSRFASSFGASYELAKGHRLGLTGIYRQESFQSVDTKMAYLTYTMGF